MDDLSADPTANANRVFVVHGRDHHVRNALFELLRAFGLQPIEWTEAVRATNNTMPAILEILRAGLSMPRAVVVLLTPDDRGILRRQFQSNSDSDDETTLFGQPRLNVIFEAGLACALFPQSTIFVERGRLRSFSDLDGLHRVRITADDSWKLELRRRLQTAGCPVSDNEAWRGVRGFGSPLLARWDQYLKGGRRYQDLLDSDELDEARWSDPPLTREICAFGLISAIQEAKDMAYWVEVTRESEDAALLLVEFMINSPLSHDRPRFRAARALELFDDAQRSTALAAARSQSSSVMLPVNDALLKAVERREVEQFCRATELIESEESRAILLTEFMVFPSLQIRLFKQRD